MRADFSATLNPDGSVATSGMATRYPSKEGYQYNSNGSITQLFDVPEQGLGPFGPKNSPMSSGDSDSGGARTFAHPAAQ